MFKQATKQAYKYGLFRMEAVPDCKKTVQKEHFNYGDQPDETVQGKYSAQMEGVLRSTGSKPTSAGKTGSKAFVWGLAKYLSRMA